MQHSSTKEQTASVVPVFNIPSIVGHWTLDTGLLLFLLCSYLKSLVPSFNECVDQFLERLRPLADCRTQVSMIQQFSELTLDVISKVQLSGSLLKLSLL